MAVASSYNIIYVTEYGEAPAMKTDQYGKFTAEMLPVLEYSGYIHTGWYTSSSFSESTKINVGDAVEGHTTSTDLTLYAGWEKAFIGIQGQIDRITGEVSAQAELITQIMTAMEGKTGGTALTPATLTVMDSDVRVKVVYTNAAGEPVVADTVVYSTNYEIGVPSLVGIFDGFGGAMTGDGEGYRLYGDLYDSCFWVTGDCEIIVLGK